MNVIKSSNEVKCIVQGCTSTLSDNILMYKLPSLHSGKAKLRRRAKLWLEKLDLDHLASDVNVDTQDHLVCQLHFTFGTPYHRNVNYLPRINTDLLDVRYKPCPNRNGYFVRHEVKGKVDYKLSKDTKINSEFLLKKYLAIFREPPNMINILPAENLNVYVCYSCEDMFKIKESFLDHINRRGMLLSYECDKCHKTITYFNPCSLLLHYRHHYIRGDIKAHELFLDLNRVRINVVPNQLVGLFRHPTVRGSYHLKENTEGEHRHISTKFLKPIPAYKGEYRIKMKSYRLIFSSNETTLALHQTSSTLPLCKFVKWTTGGVDNETAAQCTECERKVPKITAHFSRRRKLRACNVCRYTATNPCSYKAHARLHLGYLKPPYVCPECGIKFPKFVELHKHMEMVCCHLVKEARYECFQCKMLFSKRDLFIKHLHKHVNRNRKLCDCKAMVINARKHVLNHVRLAMKHAVFVYVCCRRIYRSRASYKRHVLLTHTDILNISTLDYCMYCMFCNKSLFNPHSLLMHLYRCRNQVKRSSHELFGCVKCGTFLTQSELSKHKQQCPIDDAETNKRSTKRPIELYAAEDSFRCHFCDLLTVDRSFFAQHVKSHKTNAAHYQCMDCGECFVVKPSLVRHLNYTHLIDDVDKYFAANDCYTPPVKRSNGRDSSASGGVLAPNQCEVCRKQFGTKAELNKHLRTHGMAFLRENCR